jgi:hypothetical protein
MMMTEKLTGGGLGIEEYQNMLTTNKMIRATDIETSSTSTDSSEWQTVKSRRTAVPRGSAAYTASGNGYLPPSLRAAAAEAEAAKKPTSLCADDFPAFGMAPKPLAGAWGAKTSFAQKVNELIVQEQRTEAEKEVEREAAKEMEGWTVLSLCFDKERYENYAEMFAVGARLERLVTDAAITECLNNGSSEPMRYTTDYDNLEEVSDDE